MRTLAESSDNIKFKCHENGCKEYIEPVISDSDIIDISKAASSNYFCVFSRLPNIIYYLQSFSLPSATNNKITIPMPQHASSYYVAGHTAEYEEFTANFIMDENFMTYFSTLKWMRDNETKPNFEDTISRASLIILNNAKMPLIRIDFRDIFPSSIGDLQFSNQSADVVAWYATFTTYSYSVTYLDGSNFSIPAYYNTYKHGQK